LGDSGRSIGFPISLVERVASPPTGDVRGGGAGQGLRLRVGSINEGCTRAIGASVNSALLGKVTLSKVAVNLNFDTAGGRSDFGESLAGTDSKVGNRFKGELSCASGGEVKEIGD
jgi:hypothetical protein